MNKYSFHINTLEEYATHLQHITSWWNENKHSAELLHKVLIVLDEWLSNVCKSNSPVSIDVELELDNDYVHIHCQDNGKEFHWQHQSNVNAEQTLDERNVGGLGLFIIEQLVASWKYIRSDEKNYFTCKILLNEHN